MKQSETRRAFTLLELLMVVAIIAILAALLLPVLGRAKEKAYTVVCISQQRQLLSAWLMYTADNNGALVSADTKFEDCWTRHANTPGAIETGLLYPYVDSIDLYHCPKDDTDHLRSYSLSVYLNSRQVAPLKTARQLPQVAEPSNTLTFVEEKSPNRINGGAFIFPGAWSPDQWTDPIASWHLQGCTYSYCDGHVEYRRHEDPRTLWLDRHYTNHPGSPDIMWIKDRAPARR